MTHPTTNRALALGVAALALGALAALLVGSWRLALFLASLAVLIPLGLRWRARLIDSPEAALWFLLVPMGVWLVALMPPIASVSWDGQTHFRAALSMASGGHAHFSAADEIMADRDGIYDVGLVPFGTSDDDWHPNWRLSLTEEGLARQMEVLEAAAGEPASEPLGVSEGYALSDMLKGGFIARIPMAAGLWLGQALGLPILFTYALGRIANYALWCVLCRIAMGRLRSGKWLFLVICLLPTQLFIAASYSYDPWCVGMAAIATCSLVGCLQRGGEPLSLADALWMIVPWLLATSVKAILFPWGLAFLVLPRAKFRHRWSSWLWRAAWLGAMAFLVVGFMSPFVSTSGASNVDTQAVSDVRPMDQLHLMLTEPWRFAVACLLTALDYLNPWTLFTGFLVMTCYLPQPAIWVLLSAVEWALLIWLTMADRGAGWRWAMGAGGRRVRLWALVGFVLAFGALFTSLYVGYNVPGNLYVLGMQTRYYLMFLPLILIVVAAGDGARAMTWLGRHLPEGLARVVAPSDAFAETAAPAPAPEAAPAPAPEAAPAPAPEAAPAPAPEAAPAPAPEADAHGPHAESPYADGHCADGHCADGPKAESPEADGPSAGATEKTAPWWVEANPRARTLIVATEAVALVAFVLFGFVVWF